MNVNKIAANITRELLSVAARYTMLRNITLEGTRFNKGDSLEIVKYSKKYPFKVEFKKNTGETIVMRIPEAYRFVKGMPKPPSMRQIENWMEEGSAKAVDGKTVEPDGTSPSGAPSWLLVLGLI